MLRDCRRGVQSKYMTGGPKLAERGRGRTLPAQGLETASKSALPLPPRPIRSYAAGAMVLPNVWVMIGEMTG
jgi:hypothetical protein